MSQCVKLKTKPKTKNCDDILSYSPQSSNINSKENLEDHIYNQILHKNKLLTAVQEV